MEKSTREKNPATVNFRATKNEAEQEREPDAEVIDDTAKALATPQIQASEEPSPLFSFRRLFAYCIREALELRRDPIRLSFAVFGTAFSC